MYYYKNIKELKNNLWQAIFSVLLKWACPRWNIIEQEKRDRYEKVKPEFITKHAERRIKERFEVYGIWLKKIKNDIYHKRKREIRRDWSYKIVWSLGTYIISQQHVLITVY